MTRSHAASFLSSGSGERQEGGAADHTMLHNCISGKRIPVMTANVTQNWKCFYHIAGLSRYVIIVNRKGLVILLINNL